MVVDCAAVINRLDETGGPGGGAVAMEMDDGVFLG